MVMGSIRIWGLLDARALLTDETLHIYPNAAAGASPRRVSLVHTMPDRVRADKEWNSFARGARSLHRRKCLLSLTLSRPPSLRLLL